MLLLVSRRVPASATTAHTRPMSQLDDALKQFKLSTAASRENLRNSRQDLNQMEEHVRFDSLDDSLMIYLDYRWK